MIERILSVLHQKLEKLSVNSFTLVGNFDTHAMLSSSTRTMNVTKPGTDSRRCPSSPIAPNPYIWT
ncbi:hypothetical protein M378DRAFT_174023 [Amanita muscaria Koide BX008]|uniref:Uncharacterized protein n=1 Tax=Amanita muscaria (strain Koide BX008) TaxID=946122 RepID=A0A0C2WDX4_AMAMK|nr:hypothetical protein M378DRAFT_174023 [Amanita muscaria Koide BX008]